MSLDATYIVKKPLITEKSTWEGSARNRYAFEVDTRARKADVKKAIEEIYGVRVEKVATQVRKGKVRRTRYGQTNTGDWKKAVVQLHADDTIDLF